MKPLPKKDAPGVAGGYRPEPVPNPEMEGPLAPRPLTDTLPTLPDPPQPD